MFSKLFAFDRPCLEVAEERARVRAEDFRRHVDERFKLDDFSSIALSFLVELRKR